MKKIAGVVSMAVVSLVLSSAAYAGPILTVGNNPQSGDENILLNTGVVDNPVFGLTNQSGLTVQFLSNELLVAPSNGQARVEALDGTLTYLDVSMPGNSFRSLIFNLDADANGTIDFTAYDTDGNAFVFSDYALGKSGSNFFTFTTDSLAFSHISFTTDTPVTLTDAEQFRIGTAGLSTTAEVPAAVPEPVTLLMDGSGLVGCAARMRRKGAKR